MIPQLLVAGNASSSSFVISFLISSLHSSVAVHSHQRCLVDSLSPVKQKEHRAVFRKPALSSLSPVGTASPRVDLMYPRCFGLS